MPPKKAPKTKDNLLKPTKLPTVLSTGRATRANSDTAAAKEYIHAKHEAREDTRPAEAKKVLRLWRALLAIQPQSYQIYDFFSLAEPLSKYFKEFLPEEARITVNNSGYRDRYIQDEFCSLRKKVAEGNATDHEENIYKHLIAFAANLNLTTQQADVDFYVRGQKLSCDTWGFCSGELKGMVDSLIDRIRTTQDGNKGGQTGDKPLKRAFGKEGLLSREYVECQRAIENLRPTTKKPDWERQEKEASRLNKEIAKLGTTYEAVPNDLNTDAIIQHVMEALGGGVPPKENKSPHTAKSPKRKGTKKDEKKPKKGKGWTVTEDGDQCYKHDDLEMWDPNGRLEARRKVWGVGTQVIVAMGRPDACIHRIKGLKESGLDIEKFECFDLDREASTKNPDGYFGNLEGINKKWINGWSGIAFNDKFAEGVDALLGPKKITSIYRNGILCRMADRRYPPTYVKVMWSLKCHVLFDVKPKPAQKAKKKSARKSKEKEEPEEIITWETRSRLYQIYGAKSFEAKLEIDKRIYQTALTMQQRYETPPEADSDEERVLKEESDVEEGINDKPSKSKRRNTKLNSKEGKGDNIDTDTDTNIDTGKDTDTDTDTDANMKNRSAYSHHYDAENGQDGNESDESEEIVPPSNRRNTRSKSKTQSKKRQDSHAGPSESARRSDEDKKNKDNTGNKKKEKVNKEKEKKYSKKEKERTTEEGKKSKKKRGEEEKKKKKGKKEKGYGGTEEEEEGRESEEESEEKVSEEVESGEDKSGEDESGEKESKEEESEGEEESETEPLPSMKKKKAPTNRKTNIKREKWYSSDETE
ncbi:hypothetical protein TWF281_002139 [Arthrobotrys megalospora]